MPDTNKTPTLAATGSGQAEFLKHAGQDTRVGPPQPEGRNRDVITEQRRCEWCRCPIVVRKTGGRAQRFCSQKCCRQYWQRLSTWTDEQVRQGNISIDDLKRSDSHEASHCHQKIVHALGQFKTCDENT